MTGVQRLSACILPLLVLTLFFYPVLLSAEPTLSSEDYLSQPFESTGTVETPTGETVDLATGGNEPGFYWFLFKLAGGLALIVFAIWGLGKLLQRSGLSSRGNRFMKVHSNLPLGREQFLRIIQVGSRYLLIGVTPEAINKIIEITDEEFIQELQQSENLSDESGQPADFSATLKRFLGTGGQQFQQSENTPEFAALEQRLQELNSSQENSL